VHYRRQVQCYLARVGGHPVTHYGEWALCPTGLSAESVVYSFGIGEDISFDLDLIRRYGIRVHAFDPTPASHRWLATQATPDALVVYDYGLADYDGTASFHAPANPGHISHSMLSASHTGSETIDVPVHRLGTIMATLGHERIDLLKMDIEGAEYDAITDLVESGLDVRQMLVEFHHRFDTVSPERTAEAVRQLNSAGFRIAHVSARGEEYTFVRSV
jgi:FkbM family methyltransferase